MDGETEVGALGALTPVATPDPPTPGRVFPANAVSAAVNAPPTPAVNSPVVRCGGNKNFRNDTARNGSSRKSTSTNASRRASAYIGTSTDASGYTGIRRTGRRSCFPGTSRRTSTGTGISAKFGE
jgi:hypothetical protein